MPDNPPAYPPPTGAPSAPGTPPPPVYQGPSAPDYVQPYLQKQPYAGQQQPYPAAGPMGVGGAAAMLSQVTARAASSCGIGVVTIVALFFCNIVFYPLALVGLF